MTPDEIAEARAMLDASGVGAMIETMLAGPTTLDSLEAILTPLGLTVEDLRQVFRC